MKNHAMKFHPIDAFKSAAYKSHLNVWLQQQARQDYWCLQTFNRVYLKPILGLFVIKIVPARITGFPRNNNYKGKHHG